MPLNAEYCCVGICAVTAMLLQGKAVEDSPAESCDVVAARIYQSLKTQRQVSFPLRVMVDGKELPIDARESLRALSTAVADLYKQDYARSLKSEEGIRRLRVAEELYLHNDKDLKKVLQADADHVEMFFAIGTRFFPDGKMKPTNHAVLIGQKDNGETYVYDPNDPGQQLDCRTVETAMGLTVEWKSRYRDTGEVTTQRYRIVPKDDYLGRAFPVE
jgi:hypothetical protein